MQTDPIGYSAGMNLYAYCRNNPLVFTDPLGYAKQVKEATGRMMFTPHNKTPESAWKQVIVDQADYATIAWAPDISMAVTSAYLNALCSLAGAIQSTGSTADQYGIRAWIEIRDFNDIDEDGEWDDDEIGSESWVEVRGVIVLGDQVKYEDTGKVFWTGYYYAGFVKKDIATVAWNAALAAMNAYPHEVHEKH